MKHYRVRRVGLLSLASLGGVLGALLGLPPAIVIAAVVRSLAAAGRGLLEHWQQVSVGVVSVDLVKALHLGSLLVTLQALDELGWWSALFLVAALCAAAGVAAALAALAAGLGYNLLAQLSGGLELELEPATGEESSAGAD